MTDDEVRAWIADRHGAAALDRLEGFVAMLVAETGRHNLISRASVSHVWHRHILDSAQLAGLSTAAGLWLDIGSGGGLPGMVLALLRPERPFILCEPRRLRAIFLQDVVDRLDVADQVTIQPRRVEALAVAAETITARAVGTLDTIFTWARSCANNRTTWILPRGQGGLAEIQASTMMPASFHVEQSLTDPSAIILVAEGVA